MLLPAIQAQGPRLGRLHGPLSSSHATAAAAASLSGLPTRLAHARGGRRSREAAIDRVVHSCLHIRAESTVLGSQATSMQPQPQQQQQQQQQQLSSNGAHLPSLVHPHSPAPPSPSPQLVSPLSASAPLIDSRAYVHPNAVIMEGVEIGPFCTVGPHVTLGRNCKLHAGCHVAGHTTVGDSCTLLSGAIVGADIPGTTLLGSHNTIGHHAVVGALCQDLKYKEGSECFLEIGSHNDIREHTQIHRSSKPDDVTRLGDHNLIMGACHIAHDCQVGSHNILANATMLAGHVIVEDYVHTGGLTGVHQFCHIGAYAFVAGGSVVVQDVPCFTMVQGDRAELRGLNLVGLSRACFSPQQIRAIRKAYQALFVSSDPSSTLDARLLEVESSDLFSQTYVVRLLHSIRESCGPKRRGICSFRQWTSVE